MRIRKYCEKDFDSIRGICKKTCTDKYLLNNEIVLYSKYADYYTLFEPQNIFVACNDYDEPIGYILCSTSPELFYKTWKSDYKKRINVKGALFQKIVLKLALRDSKRMAKYGYSCHMHIDILPQYQRLGIGKKLVDTLIKHLKENNMDGLYLACSLNNTIGNKFYKKYGFNIHHSEIGCTIYSMKLK